MAISKVFIDTNIIIDITTWRMPQYDSSEKLLNAAYASVIKTYTSIVCFANAYYVTEAINKDNDTAQKLMSLRQIIEILPVDEKMADNALFLKFNDFEDALVYTCAKYFALDAAIITHNTKDFKRSDIPIYTPKQFLSHLNSQFSAI